MKPLKAVAVVAGSLVVAGAATPAFASDASGPAPTDTSLHDALKTLTSQRDLDVRPFRHRSDALNSENKNSVLSTVKNASTDVNQRGATGRLLGGLPLQGR
ncbi:MAG: hypothetical protein LBV60_25520 [Streptomyces sp.]|jgi:hypothetical protein|nr:hypothetical protein [Streptomyces sp.]